MDLDEEVEFGGAFPERFEALLGEGSVATAMVRQWVSEDCRAGSEPEYLTIGGSDARAQALLSGQIDATALEVTDAVTLERAGGGKGLHRLVDFKEVFPGLHPQTVYANEDTVAQGSSATG
ncbi:hypothetical protein [Streptomyces sp. NBC_00286]|uniref:hypothetical protein n=1 Tax=Streptomyces sp. NBC_00286 TaxID=2975701 RepID=UPI002E2D262A|nr:hypothetical protein [Streptomyces sp. NBC_00286]